MIWRRYPNYAATFVFICDMIISFCLEGLICANADKELIYFHLGVWDGRAYCWCPELLAGAFFVLFFFFNFKILYLETENYLWHYVVKLVERKCSPYVNQFVLQAFVGIAHDLNAIVIAFRGTQERRYWWSTHGRIIIFFYQHAELTFCYKVDCLFIL